MQIRNPVKADVWVADDKGNKVPGTVVLPVGTIAGFPAEVVPLPKGTVVAPKADVIPSPASSAATFQK